MIFTSRSILTSIIGFLFGYIIFPDMIFIFLCGGVGYFLGLLLDSVDIKNQLDVFYFNDIHATQDIFHPEDIPEAIIIYSRKDNQTTVLMDFRVDSKPQDFRLSVLKNLQEFEFRLMEDANKTIFNLIFEYHDCNYPQILFSPDQKAELHFDIKERSKDFQTAVQKIVPGLDLSVIPHTDLYGEISIDNSVEPSVLANFRSPLSPSNYKKNEINTIEFNPETNERQEGGIKSKESENGSVYRELINYPPSPEMHELQETFLTSPNEEMDNEVIMNDLLGDSLSSKDPIDPIIPNLSPEEVRELKNMNKKVFEDFLDNENNELTSVSLRKANKLKNEHQKETNEGFMVTNTSESNNINIDYSEIQKSTGNTELIDNFSVKWIDELDEFIKKNNEKNARNEIT